MLAVAGEPRAACPNYGYKSSFSLKIDKLNHYDRRMGKGAILGGVGVKKKDS